MTQCIQPDALMKLITNTLESAIHQYILCGALQGGLKACGETSLLPRDTEIVLCRQLAGLVQDGIDDGSIVAPTVTSVRTEETLLILSLANGSELQVDLRTAFDHAISEAFVDCDGERIIKGAALATCQNLEVLKQKYDQHYAMIDQALANHIKWHEDSFQQLGLNLSQEIAIKTAEWANGILKQLVELVHEMHTVYHDESLVGDGHEPAPLRVNEEWLAEQIKNIVEDIIKDVIGDYTQDLTVEIMNLLRFTDCAGEQFSFSNKPIVTCANLDERIATFEQWVRQFPPGITDCKKDPIQRGDAVASCRDLNELKIDLEKQIAAGGGGGGDVTLVDCKGANIPSGTAVATCADLKDAVDDLQEKIENASGTYMLKDCAGTAIPTGTEVPTCAQLDALIEDAVTEKVNEILGKLNIASMIIPLDVTLQSSQSITVSGVSIQGHGFSKEHTDRDARATVAVTQKDFCSGSDTEIVAYIYPQADAARFIVVPIYGCDGTIKGWASSMPFLPKAVA